MATPKQFAANRANAQKSTGPRTLEGKAKSSLNAVSHGFTGGLMFLEGEDPHDFYGLLTDLTTEHQPATHTEQILVEKMALNQWLSLRATRFQSIRIGMMGPENALPQDFSTFLRYQANADRAFHKAHADLLKIQKERKNSEIGFVSEPAEELAAESIVDPGESALPAPKTPEIEVPEEKMVAVGEKLSQAA
jgi:hypothetical protein